MASGVSFSGLGSGIDFSKLTDSVVAERSRPVAQLQSKEADYSKRSDALKQLNAKLAVLTQAAKSLTESSLGTGRIATSSAAGVVTATSAEAATPGTVSLNVSRLATSLVQASRAYTTKDGPILAGGATTATFELRKGGEATGTEITIDATNNSLSGLRDAINAAAAGVTATIVDTDGTGTKQKLVLNSTGTGAANPAPSA